jgi:hypothetical protein
MKMIGTILITIIGSYFVGAITFFGSSALVYVMTRLGNWVLSLPMWGMVISFVIIGLVVIELYKKLPKQK